MTIRRPDCLLIEGCDFHSFPPGGQLSTAKQLIAAFGERLALVGISTDDTPVGRWVTRRLAGLDLPYFSVARRTPEARRPFVPARLAQAVALSSFATEILSLGVRNAFVQAPENLLVVSGWRLDNVCYRLAGIDNPLIMPRYAWGRPLAGVFERAVLGAMERANVILASADERAIQNLVQSSRGRIPRERVVHLPTHYDSAVFYPRDRQECRRELGLPEHATVVASSGRINEVKGWDLVLDAFHAFHAGRPDALLVFVGDGEDREALERRVAALGLDGSVRVTGFVPPPLVAKHVAAADVVAVGSHQEGWSVAMLEALACGKPIVSTDVSGARELVAEGQNGFVLDSRSPDAFAAALGAAVRLDGAAPVSVSIARRYDVADIAAHVGEAWPVLA